MTRPLRLLGGLLIVGVLAIVLLILFPSLPDPTCAALLLRSASDVPNGRRLVFKEWITCTEVPAGGFVFMNDPHWLPSYVPGTYQFRRTVMIIPYAQPTPQGSPIIAEVCLMPWRKYVPQLAGQCDGRYKVWR
jgi:hypothetical protein